MKIVDRKVTLCQLFAFFLDNVGKKFAIVKVLPRENEIHNQLLSCGLNEVSGRMKNVSRSVANLGKDQKRYKEDQSDCFHFIRRFEC